MRIHSDNSESFIEALAASITKDPASLEGWNLMHIRYNNDALSINCLDIFQQLKKLHPDVDCEVVQYHSNDVFFISRSLQHQQIHSLADEFIRIACISDENIIEYAMYELFYDWRLVLSLFSVESSKLETTEKTTNPYNFGEIASLSEVFAEAKKLRKVRLPLHVMIVEDDALTRRLVTNSFKESFALITAENAQEAIMNYLVHAPDIVFLDIGLPDTSGFDVLHQIMASDKDAYVVMFSSNSYLDNITKSILNGASGFVAKPFKKEKVHTYIQDSALHHNKNCA